MPGDEGQLLRHFLGGDAPYPRVDLIEDHGIDAADADEHRLQGQRQAAQFAAGGNPSQRLQRFPRVGGEKQFHLVFPVRGKVRFFRKGDL